MSAVQTQWRSVYSLVWLCDSSRRSSTSFISPPAQLKTFTQVTMVTCQGFLFPGWGVDISLCPCHFTVVRKSYLPESAHTAAPRPSRVTTLVHVFTPCHQSVNGTIGVCVICNHQSPYHAPFSEITGTYLNIMSIPIYPICKYPRYPGEKYSNIFLFYCISLSDNTMRNTGDGLNGKESDQCYVSVLSMPIQTGIYCHWTMQHHVPLENPPAST